ncbi:MAG: peptide-methionine (R)-S-oxide reductase MsrB [Fimbriimonadaceae bacterium]
MKLPLLAIATAAAAIGLGFYALTNQQRTPSDEMTIGGIKVTNKSPERKDKVIKTDAEWKKQLTSDQYRILRAEGTEAAFCGGHLNNKEKGTYSCVGCGLPIFKSDAKFESGTGWPSFFQPYKQENVWLKADNSFGMTRFEVRCARCDGHLGHVFDDGPSDKTGLRYCINGDILTFKKDEK